VLKRDDIAQGFRDLGVKVGAILIVHSSLSSFGRVDGGTETVIEGLLDALGPEGTLLAPTLTGHEGLSPENPPHFDLRSEPCWTGVIAETLRLRPDAIRSTHPTHSCAAVGRLAEEVTRDHHLSPTPCGLTSPYFRVAELGGFIAMIGCTLDTCTTFHTIEELANLPYVCQDAVARGSVVDRHGVRVETPCRLHSYAGPERDFPVMEPILLESGLMTIGMVGESTVRLIDSMGLITSTMEQLRLDPLFVTRERTGR
jgi:aminoglycoside 3-N-acetyltransferase